MGRATRKWPQVAVLSPVQMAPERTNEHTSLRQLTLFTTTKYRIFESPQRKPWTTQMASVLHQSERDGLRKKPGAESVGLSQ